MAVNATGPSYNSSGLRDTYYDNLLSGEGEKVSTKGTNYNAVFTDKQTNSVSVDDFLNLMVAQLKNQDFMNPVDDTQFVTQLAQFATMQQMQELAAYSKQSYVMSLVGKEVTAAKFTVSGDVDRTVGTVTKISLVNNEYKIYIGDKSYTLEQIMEIHDGPVENKPQTNPDGTVTNPDGTITYPDGSIKDKDGNITHPDGSVEDKNGVITYPDGSVKDPDGDITYPDGSIKHPDGSTTYPDGTTVGANGSIQYPDGIITYPDGTVKHPNGDIAYPDGTIKHKDGSVTRPDGTTLYTDGSIKRVDGTILYPDGTIKQLDGTILHPDGSITDEDGNPIGETFEALWAAEGGEGEHSDTADEMSASGAADPAGESTDATGMESAGDEAEEGTLPTEGM